MSNNELHNEAFVEDAMSCKNIRKIIQISATSDLENESIYALCDDGTLWFGYWKQTVMMWKQLNLPVLNNERDNERSNFNHP